MKPIDIPECEAHVLVCTNERPAGKMCCKAYGGQEFFEGLKKKVKEHNLADKYWVTRTGCLGFCNAKGTTVVVRKKDQKPEWYSEVEQSEMGTIWEKLKEE